MINFLIGSQTNNVQQEIINKLVNDYLNDRTKQYFFIVPNHIKFDTEVQVMKTLAAKEGTSSISVKNIQVLSFSRLAWFLLKEANIIIPSELTDAAATMVLQRIVKKVQPELIIYKNTKINAGMIAQIYKSINELQVGNVSPEDLLNYNLDELSLETKAKIHDLRLIYPTFVEALADKYITKQETLQILNNYLSSKECDLSTTNFYLSDFSQFSTQEQLMLKVLLVKAQNITLGFKTGSGKLNYEATINDYDGNIQLLIQRLVNFANQKNKEIIFSNASLQANDEGLIQLNRLWSGNKTTEIDYQKNIQLIKADTRYAESYFVAQTIYREVALNNHRYKDFVILAPSLTNYETHLGPIFKQLNIPYFIDLQKEMKYHPLVILIESLAELMQQPLKTDAIIKLLKTDLVNSTDFTDEENRNLRDQLENFALKYGINFKRWNQDLTDFLDPEFLQKQIQKNQLRDLQKLNNYKNQIIQPITGFLKTFKTEKETNKALQKFNDFLEMLMIPKQLESWRDEANNFGDLQLAQQPEEVWQTLNQLLDDYRLINAEKFDSIEFFETLIAGFSQANFSQIPSTLDAVNISELGMVQSNRYQQSFIIGATMGDLPQNQSSPKFLNSENINELSDQFTETSFLEDQARTNAQMQNFQFGQALLTGAKRVYLSYPLINDENKQLKPSLYYAKIKASCHLEEYCQFDLPDLNGTNIGSYLATPLSSAAYLAYLINNQDTEETTKKLANKLMNLALSIDPENIQKFIEAQNYNNTPEELTNEQSDALFGQTLSTSISQLESYYRNPFEYFLKYGLRLRKRDLNEFDAIQTGNYFHEIFDELVKKVVKEAIEVNQLTPQQLDDLIREIQTNVQNLPKYQHYLEDEINLYLASQLNKTATNITQTWFKRLKNTPLKPAKSELVFGQGEIPGLNYLVDDHQVKLRGKIDRIDLAKTDKGIVAQVIDYKSSEQDFNLNKFYNGLSLQMVSYLKVLKENPDILAPNDKLLLAGAFYQIISRKPISINKDGFSKREFNPVNIDTKFIQKQRLKGLMISDEDIFAEIEPNLMGPSEIYQSLSFVKKYNSLKVSKNGFTPNEMDVVIAYDDLLIRDAARKIYQGQFPLAPFKDGQRNEVSESDYKDILLFDAMMPENNYQKIANLKQNELLDLMKERLDNE